MKRLIYLATILFLTSCSYVRIGDLTMVSNRNYDESKEYVLFAKQVTAIGKQRKGDALERAIDNACASVGGEHMRNVSIYVTDNGNRVKVTGDVYGLKEVKDKIVEKKEEYNETYKPKIEIGDRVYFTKMLSNYEGTVLGFNGTQALIEIEDANGYKRKLKAPISSLTKIEK